MSDEIYKFEKKAGFDNTSSEQLVKWMNEEVKNYEDARTKIIKRNKLMDIICLCIQISRREDMDLDSAWKKWWRKSRKYLDNNLGAKK